MNLAPIAIDPSTRITDHFLWHEALWLPQWQRHATEADGLTDKILSNLDALFHQMEVVRADIKAPMVVHVAYRPPLYNALSNVRGAPNSAHLGGKALDFHFSNMGCDDARKLILDHCLLEKLGLRMENRPGSGWIHLDTRAVLPGHERYFLP